MKRFLFLILFAFLSFNVFAKYNKGDFTIGFRLPFSVPTFISLEQGETNNHYTQLLTFSQMGYKNIQVGIEADVGYFLDNKISVGGIIGYNFAYDRGDRLLSRVPVLFKANYIAYSQGIIDVPLSFLLGVNYWKYHSQEHFVLQTGMEVGLNVYWSENWGVLFRTGLWIYPELYIDSFKNNITGFIPVVIGVIYRR